MDGSETSIRGRTGLTSRLARREHPSISLRLSIGSVNSDTVPRIQVLRVVTGKVD